MVFSAFNNAGIIAAYIAIFNCESATQKCPVSRYV
jgi:hypothetical protein